MTKREKRKQEKRTRHHRKPRSVGGSGKPRNISMVRHSDHVAFHKLFANGQVDVVIAILNEVWIDPDVEVFYRKREPPVAHPQQRRQGRNSPKRRSNS